MSQRKMLKCQLVCRAKDAEGVLEALQDAALLHVSEIEIPEALAEQLAPEPDPEREAEDAELLARRARLERRRRALANVAPAPARLQAIDVSYMEVGDIVDDLLDRRDAAGDALAGFSAQCDQLVPWGDIDFDEVADLERRGLQLRFARVVHTEWPKLDKRGLAFQVASENDQWVYALFFVDETKGVATELAVEGLDLPRRPLSELRAQCESLEEEIRRINRELGRYAQYRPLIEERVHALNDSAAIIAARQKGLHHAGLLAIEGYLPEEEAASLHRALTDYDVALSLDSVSHDDDRAPVSLKNGPFARGFEAIVRAFSGMSHHEKDYTWAAGLLFIVFGSLCLLDGGYGLLLLLTGVVLKLTGNDSFGRVFAITGVFSIIVGALAGQYFGLVVGQHIFVGRAPLLTLAQEPFHAFVFSLVVGIVGIAFAYSVAIWQRGIGTQATGSLLFVCAAVAALFGDAIVGTMASEYVLNIAHGWHPVPAETIAGVSTWGNRLAVVFLVAAVAAWMIFPEPVFGREARAGNIAWTLYSGTTGFVQDLLSHMRLFGISLSGAIMALVVNDIGAQFPFAITVVFAVVGHLFVYVLALLSLYIHTNRLIFLEFGSKCIDGGQNFYTPLRRNAA